MTGWPRARLEDVASIASGGTPPRGDADNFDGTIPWAKIADVTRARTWLLETEEYISARAAAIGRLPIFPRGTVLLAMYGSIGETAIAGISTTTNQAILGIQCGPNLLPEFLSFYLRTISSKLRALGRGGTQANINAGMVKALRVPLPEIELQRWVVAELTDQLRAVDSARAAALQTRSSADHLRGQAYELAFQGLTPLAVGDHVAAPEGWKWHLLSDLGRLESGHTPSRSRPDWWGGEVPWIALPDIRALDGLVTFETVQSTNPDGIAHSAARVLPAGTVVMSRTASVGFVTRMGRPMATSQDFVNWVCGPMLDPEFLMHLLIRSRSYVRSLSSGAVHKTVYFPTVKAFRVCVPSASEQRRIAASLSEQLAKIDSMATTVDAELEAINALPAALLRRAFAEQRVA
jgi:type I restriction enzyme S subunit